MPQTVIRVFRDANGVVPLTVWLDELEVREPRAYAKCLEIILRLSHLGHELRRPASDALRNGIRELRAVVGTVQYRILYFFHGPHAACVSHGITKGGKVPDAEIDLAVRRKELVERNADKYTAFWEV